MHPVRPISMLLHARLPCCLTLSACCAAAPLPFCCLPFAASLRFKLMAVYLAEDVNATTLRPLYGARIPGVIADTGADFEGELSDLQRKRRVWTHAQCDPDGDAWIHDCDISAGWKYRWVMKGQGPMLQP